MPAFTNDSAISLPLDSYIESDAQEEAGLRANDILVDRCMAQHGFSFHMGTPVEASSILSAHVGRFYADNLDLARKYGYAGSKTLLKNLPGASSGDGVKSAAEAAAYVGGTQISASSTPGGCLGWAEGVVEKGAPASTIDQAMIVNSMVNSTYTQMLADSRVVKATAAWSACMAKAGYRFSTPKAATDGSVVVADEKSGKVAPAEIAQAVQDVTCKQKADLVPLELAVWAAYQDRLIAQNQRELDLEKAQLAAETRNADAVITGAGA